MEFIANILIVVFWISIGYIIYAFIKKKEKKMAAVIAVISFTLAIILLPKENTNTEKVTKETKRTTENLKKIDPQKLIKNIEAAAFPSKVNIDNKNIIVELQGKFKSKPKFDLYFPQIGHTFDEICKYDLNDYMFIVFDMKPKYEGTQRHLMKIRFAISTTCNTWKDLREKQKRYLGSSVYAIFNTYLYPSDVSIYDKDSFIEACENRPEIQAFCRRNL